MFKTCGFINGPCKQPCGDPALSSSRLAAAPQVTVNCAGNVFCPPMGLQPLHKAWLTANQAREPALPTSAPSIVGPATGGYTQPT